MTPKTKQLLRDQKGMTLLEIMIVLAILGGLLAVLATNVMSSFNKSKVKNTKIQMDQIKTQLNMFYTDCGYYPETLDGLIENPGCDNWGPDPYAPSIPKDAWSNQFNYEPDGSSFFLQSLGEDRREGGEGLAADITVE